MSGDVIITVTLNAALHVAYTTGDLAAEGTSPVSRPSYRAGADLIRLGAGAAAVAAGGLVCAVTATGEWTARVEATDVTGVTGVTGTDPVCRPARGALVAGLVPGQLLGWSWPDRLRHALALATGGAGAWTRAPGTPEDGDHVDLAAYERLLDAVQVEPSAR